MSRKLNPNSLDNLKKGRVGKEKVRVNVTLLPETLIELDKFGNRSEAIDKAIKILKKYELLVEIELD